MKKLIFSVSCTLLIALNPALASAQERIGDFSLLDDRGYFHHMAWYDDHEVIALLVQAHDSAATATIFKRHAFYRLAAAEKISRHVGGKYSVDSLCGKVFNGALGKQDPGVIDQRC